MSEEKDRITCVPFMSELKCALTGISVWEFWNVPEKMAETERELYQRFGYDRIVIGPNTRGIMEALGARTIYPEAGAPQTDGVLIQDYEKLHSMQSIDANSDERIQVFAEEAARLREALGDSVPMEMSIGGPYTIAANLRGVERFLRDCRKSPEEVKKLLRIVTDSQKSCIRMAARYGFGIAMADPVASPSLIGPGMYEEFVFPYTKELTDYAYQVTGKKVSLHMCGRTYSIWNYLIQYQLNEISLDNIIDMERAARELGPYVTIAGNVDPVQVVMNGSREEIFAAVEACVKAGRKAEKGFHLATGCDLPEQTAPEKIEYFMEAGRFFGENPPA